MARWHSVATALAAISAAFMLLLALAYLSRSPLLNYGETATFEPYAAERERLLRETAHIHPLSSKEGKPIQGERGHHSHGGHHRHTNHTVHHKLLAAIANKTLHGALIHTVRDKAANAIQKKYYDSHVPFTLAAWPYTKATTCPGRNGQPPWLTNHEKSMSTSHLQVWLEFAFFDHDVLKARERGTHLNNGAYSSTWYSSHSGNYTLAADGSLHKHGLPFLDTDVMVVIEDSAEIAMNNATHVAAAIMTGVADMKTADMLFLGRCEGDRLKKDKKTSSGSSSSDVMCSNAYAVTRRGARALVANYDPCGRTVDELFDSLMQRGLLPQKVGSVFSAEEGLYKQGFARPPDHKHYIFHTRS